MSYMMGKPDHWYRVERDGGTPYFVRPAGRTLLADEPSPTAFVARWMEARSARKSDRNGALSAYRWPLDFRPVRIAYRAWKRLRSPRKPLCERVNAAIDALLFAEEDHAWLSIAMYGFCGLGVVYLAAQLVRAWVR